MPTPAQIESALEQIRKVMGNTYVEVDGSIYEHLPTSGQRALPFGWLTPRQQFDVLEEYVNWTGFTEDQEIDVIRRVVERQDADEWMDGLYEPGQYAQPPKEQGEMER